eukprot:TRINITY_DN5326_c0_g1_i1.p1 TRINITY_DN5326_c0_g1~~TRINITY_DN5326_c0_g1_i1.p1  ORF type:complete len:440 (+),score=87.29 TRINITY_DN5326_c0_g1_i1:30-1322(+)
MHKGEGPLRWGFVSTARIGVKNSQAVKAAGDICYAVASRSLPPAQEFARENGFEKAYGSYEELLADPLVDAIYLPTPTTHRSSFALEAIHACKHMVIDKPVCSNADEVRAIMEAADRKGVKWMDGVHNMHNPRLAYVREIMRDEVKFGALRYIHATMSFGGMHDPSFVRSNIRLDPLLEPLGALGDLGWYTIRMILVAASFEIPLCVSSTATFYDRATDSRTYTMLDGEDVRGVIETCSAQIVFPSGVLGTMTCSFDTSHRSAVDIQGTKGRIHIPDFSSPSATGSVNESGFIFFHPNEKDTRRPYQTQVIVKHAKDQHQLLWRHAHRLISGAPFFPPSSSSSCSLSSAASSSSSSIPPIITDWTLPEIHIDSDSDPLLSQRQSHLFSNISDNDHDVSFPRMALLTQAVSDAIEKSARTGGATTKVIMHA